MSLLVTQRLLVLAGVAALCALASIGAVARVDEEDGSLPAAIEAPGEGWYEALAVPARSAAARGVTGCGYRRTRDLDGVGHPVLPCGTRVYVQYDSTEALTQVVARATGSARTQFVLTPSLARKLGLESTDLIRWRYARDD